MDGVAVFIRLMGVPGIGKEPDSVVPVAGLIPRSVLAVVAMAAGRTVSAEALIDAVWDDPPRSARNAAQIASIAPARHVRTIRHRHGPRGISPR